MPDKAKNGIHEDESALSPRWSFHQSIVFTGGATVISIIVLFLETMLAVRFLDMKSYGIYVLLLAIVNFIAMSIDFGFKTSVTQYISSSNPLRQSALVSSVLLFRILQLAVISLIIWLGRELLAFIDGSKDLMKYMNYLIIMLAAFSLDELFYSMLQGFQAYDRMAFVRVARSCLRLGLSMLFLIVLKWGIFSLIYSWIISFAISVLCQYAILPISRRMIFDRHMLYEVIRFGFPLQLSRFLWFISSRLDVLLLGTLVGPQAVASYDVGVKIPGAMNYMSESFITVFFPNMTSLLAAKQNQKAVRLLNNSLRLISFLLALMTLIVVLFSQQIITIVFSDKYAESSVVLVLLMFAFHIGMMVSLMGYTMTSAGHPGRSLTENIVRTSTTVLGNLLLIPVLGFRGPAYAVLIASCLSIPISVWLLRRSKIPIDIVPCVKQTVILLFCGILFWLFQPEESIYKHLIIFLYIITNIIFSTVSRNDLRLIYPRLAAEKTG